MGPASEGAKLRSDSPLEPKPDAGQLKPPVPTHADVFSGMEDVILPKDVLRQIAIRRAKNPVRHLHHHAFRCRNAEETRHFYEDILGLPMTIAMVLDRHYTPGGKNFCHLFFELGDGSALAFFDCTGDLISRGYAPDTGMDHHIALEVESDEVLKDFEQRLTAANIRTMLVDHLVYHSLYFNDPNGLNLELVTTTPITDEHERKSTTVARRELATWMKHVHSTKGVT
jgi:catechol 2,3-dioxygenase-like lactoylglutathione lyase family enzyme